MVVKVKTSVYVDKGLWTSFKQYASKCGVEVSKMLEELIRDALIEVELDKALAEMRASYEVDFDPIEPREKTISCLVNVMRDERENSLFK